MRHKEAKEEETSLLTPREETLLIMIAKHGKVKDAVYFLNNSQDPNIDKLFPQKEFTATDGTKYTARLTEWAAYQTLRRIRIRYVRARRFVNQLVSFRRRYSNLDKVLAPKVRLKVEEEEEEEDKDEKG